MAKRIISLLPSATEIVVALGMGEFLVGRSHECDYPSFVTQLPVCTQASLNVEKPSREIDADVQSLLQAALSLYQIKTEVLEQLQPTHIVTQDQCDVCAVSFSDVKKAVSALISSDSQIISLQPNLLQEVWSDIAHVAQTLEIDPKPLLTQLQQRIQQIEAQTQNLPENSLPTVVALEWTDPLMGAGNWIPELIELAGGKPLLSKKGDQSPYITWDDLLQSDPDFIVIMPCGFDLARTDQEAQGLVQHPQWHTLRAVQQTNVYISDGNAYFNRPGPRLVDSLEILAEILHPEYFTYGYQNQAWQKLNTEIKTNSRIG
jgi:iron complex transport system substrate-binding protein